jgi:hypothetical protein
MTVKVGQITVGSTPVMVGKCTTEQMLVWVHCTGSMYFGTDNTVSSSTGFRLDNGDKYSTTVCYGDEIWAVSSTGTPILYTFVTEFK